MRCGGGCEATNGTKKPTDVGMFRDETISYRYVILTKFNIYIFCIQYKILQYTIQNYRIYNIDTLVSNLLILRNP